MLRIEYCSGMFTLTSSMVFTKQLRMRFPEKACIRLIVFPLLSSVVVQKLGRCAAGSDLMGSIRPTAGVCLMQAKRTLQCVNFSAYVNITGSFKLMRSPLR